MNSRHWPQRPLDLAHLVQVEHLHKSFAMGPRTVTVLSDISLTIAPGEMVAIVGASGAGKSTLLHIMGALDRPTKGIVRFEGRDLFQLSDDALADFRNKRIGFVFQFHHLLPEFTALENTYMPALIQKRPAHEARRDAEAILGEVGLSHRLHHKPSELSGGEQQRIAVARALIQRPDLVLADEPTGNLDTQTGDVLFKVMQDLNRKRSTAFVIVTHNEKLSSQADRIIHIQDGRLV